MLDEISAYLSRYSDLVFFVVLTIICYLLASSIIELIIRKVALPKAPTNRARTLINVIINTIKVIIFAAGTIHVLSILHINVAPFLASAGIVGLAVGFGSQVLIKDIISGIFFILENQFNENDNIRLDKVEGTVENIGLRTITVRDKDTGALYIVPNSTISQIANLTDRWARVNIPITVSVNNDVDKVLTILKNAGNKLWTTQETRQFMLEPIAIKALTDLSPTAMTCTVSIKTKPTRQDDIAQQYRYLVKKSFEKEKIELS